jgi:hypothetical protein
MAEYRIIIENQTEEKTVPVSTDPNAAGSPGGQVKEKTKGKEQSALAKAFVATNTVTPYVQQAINFSVSRIDMETGAAAMQRRAQAFSQIGGSAAGIISSAVIGGVPGAAIAVAMTALQTAIQTEFNRINLMTQKRIESENISLQRSRAGMSINRSRGGGVV